MTRNCLQLLADDYASNGFKVIVLDIFHDPAPANALDPGVSFDFMDWFSRNGPDVTEPVTRKVLAAIKAQGVTKVGILGYCYGARVAFDLAFENDVDVVAVSHPSLLQVPADFEVSFRLLTRPMHVFDYLCFHVYQNVEIHRAIEGASSY